MMFQDSNNRTSQVCSHLSRQDITAASDNTFGIFRP